MPRSYEEFVTLYLNIELVRAIAVTDASDAVAIGSGLAVTPNEWIDMIAESEGERSKWRTREFRKEV